MLTVFGSTLLSVTSRASRLPMGADIVLADNFVLKAGGRGATQALAAHLAGAKVRLASAVGMDAFGDVALVTITEKELDLSHVHRIPVPTGLCMTLCDDDGQMQRIVSRGASGAMKIDDIPDTWLDRWTTLLVQGETDEGTTMRAIDKVLGAEGKCVLHLSPLVPISETILDQVDYLVLNEMEAIELASSFAMRTDHPRVIAYDIAARRQGPVLIITPHLDLYIGLGTNVECIPHPNIPVVDMLGADDALVGVFAAGVSMGAPLADVVHRAVAAAALCASRPGLQDSLPSNEDIDKVAQNWPEEAMPERPTLRRKPVF
ncbi:MAG: PfkB family carbohydrate kinase [Pseudomonadota bacterium]